MQNVHKMHVHWFLYVCAHGNFILFVYRFGKGMTFHFILFFVWFVLFC